MNESSLLKGVQKNKIAGFLDKAAAFNKGSYDFKPRTYNFADDRPAYTAFTKSLDAGKPAFKNAVLTKDGLNEVAMEVYTCTKCALHATRTQAVPGEGVPHPLVLLIGEGPGADEDISGRPFVGKAGQLLDKMLASIGLTRNKNCFIANIVKCRPPSNRDPIFEESEACRPFLERQIELLNPLVIMGLGKVPSRELLNTDLGITKLRGRWTEYKGIPFLPTFHPSYLLRDETQKVLAWEDLKMLCRRLLDMDSVYAAETAELRRIRKI
ncbi:MAG: uracil-DNA glycosylase [Spirochaetaceae bacterium]|jgi:DNA polymerase|nr:uracil-DNA glycosylase [Spirochaetaceae bacterium]